MGAQCVSGAGRDCDSHGASEVCLAPDMVAGQDRGVGGRSRGGPDASEVCLPPDVVVVGQEETAPRPSRSVRLTFSSTVANEATQYGGINLPPQTAQHAGGVGPSHSATPPAPSTSTGVEVQDDSQSSISTSSTVTWDLIGEWRTRYGIYTVKKARDGNMLFEEPQTELHGVLKPEGDWHVAEIHDRKNGNVIFGWLRLRREGEFMRSNFTHSQTTPWSNPGLWAQRLPYLRVFHRQSSSGQASDKGTPPPTECCCICLEDFKDGEVAAQLLCHHVYHKECIRNWFGLHGSCPLRCAASECSDTIGHRFPGDA